MTPKGWSSERVPLSKHSSRSRHVASSTVALFPFSSGRTLPSKWDDAERWICSPVFGQEGSYSSKSLHLIQSERQAKSKSGPLGPQMTGNYGNYSPVMPVIYGGEERSDGVNEEEKQVRRAVSRRDMGTQMLPSDGSRSSSSTSYSSPPHDASNGTDEMVKDVKVDKEDTLPIRRSTSQNPSGRANRTHSSHDYSGHNVAESRLQNSRLQREEARIDGWENLQREKADSAVQKLEMKLEKKRSSSMEKIMKKLKRAELKAEKMRSSLSESEGRRKASRRMAGLYRRIRMGSIAECVACR
ncbi:hypothetical protein V2J09_016620 [Rumex salicifolius]